jgi:glycosidase
MTSLLLPGTSVIYYGDELGMANSTSISFEETVDPYTTHYCVEANFSLCITRDPARTPMQVKSPMFCF